MVFGYWRIENHMTAVQSEFLWNIIITLTQIYWWNIMMPTICKVIGYLFLCRISCIHKIIKYHYFSYACMFRGVHDPIFWQYLSFALCRPLSSSGLLFLDTDSVCRNRSFYNKTSGLRNMSITTFVFPKPLWPHIRYTSLRKSFNALL